MVRSLKNRWIHISPKIYSRNNQIQLCLYFSQNKIYFFYLLFHYLHLLFDRHSSNAEGSTQLWSALLLQQFAVKLDDAMCLSRQLSLK